MHDGMCLSADRDKILMQAAAWVGLEDSSVSEISQIKKDMGCMIPVMWIFRTDKVLETHRRTEVTSGLGKRKYG